MSAALVKTARRGLLLAVVCACALLTAPGVAGAHAVLVEVDPADRSALDEPPDQVRLVFDEPVEVPTGGLRVHDREARRIDEGTVGAGEAGVVAVALPGDLPDGGYVVAYRVVSQDGHPLAGVTTFRVGDAEAVGDELVAELFGGAGGDVAGIVGPLLRGLATAAVLLAAGAVAFRWRVARTQAHRADAHGLGRRAALAGLVLSVLALPVQAVAVIGTGWSRALAPDALGEVLTTAFGTGTLVRVAALGVLAWALAAGPRVRVATVAGAVALGSFVLDGHQRTQEPTWLVTAGDLVHLPAAAVWFGGLVLLAVALHRGRRGTDDPVEAAGLVARFSGLALIMVVVLAAAGLAMAVPLVGSPAALVSTAYGRLLLAKVVTTAVVVGLAAYNRRRLVPAVAAGREPRAHPATVAADVPADGPAQEPAQGPAPGADDVRHGSDGGGRAAAWERLRTTVRAEAVLLVGVVLVTGVLVGTQPASDAAGLGGVYQARTALGDELELDLVVDPNRARATNSLHVYVLDATGRPSDRVEEVRLELTYLPEDIGPIGIEPFPAGPGHWVANVDDLAFPGDWEVRVVAGVGRFDEREATVTVPVAG